MRLARALTVRTLRVDNNRHLADIELGAAYVPLKCSDGRQ